MCTWVRMSQNLVYMWLSAKNNYCRGLTKGFYHCVWVVIIHVHTRTRFHVNEVTSFNQIITRLCEVDVFSLFNSEK
jgi:hypothetical protein